MLLTAGTVGRCSHRTLLSCKHANTRNNSGQAGKLKGTTLMNTLNSIGGWCHFVFDTFTLICIANEWIDNTNSSFALRLRSLVDSENPNYWSTTYCLSSSLFIWSLNWLYSPSQQFQLSLFTSSSPNLCTNVAV